MKFDVTCVTCGNDYAVNPPHIYASPFDDEARCPKCGGHGRVHRKWVGNVAEVADLRAHVAAGETGDWSWDITDKYGHGASYGDKRPVPAVGTCSTRQEAMVAAEMAMRTAYVVLRGGEWRA
jgi:DNA-directed RNA polymerase subunit RPC12/RpoP